MSTSPRRISPPLNSLEGLPTPLTDGERHVLTLLNSELPEDWEIYIQPHLNGLRPDFVVTHPRCGIAVFEVKDWDLRAMNYRYEGERPNPILMADKGGHSFRKDDPIAKAVNYRTEVTDLYCPSLNTRQHYGLVSTGVLFTVASRADVQRVFIEEALEDLGFRNREQFILAAREDLRPGNIEQWFPRVHTESDRMSPEVVDDLRRWLVQPSFDAEQMEPIRLDRKQRNLATSRTKSGYRRIKGSAGSGKSCVLAARAAELSLEGKNVLVVTFNITLVNYLRDLAVRHARSRLKGSVTWLNYHRWAKRVCIENGRKTEYSSLWAHGKEHALETGLPQLVDRILRGGGKYRFHYDAILVDEGQDYRLEWWNSLRLALRDGGEMLLVADPTQDLYGTSRDWTNGPMPNAGFSGGNWATLSNSYRLPIDLIERAREFAELFLPDDEHRILPETRQQMLMPTTLRWIQTTPPNSPDICTKEILRLPNSDPGFTLAWSDVVFLTTNKTTGGLVVDRLRALGFKVLHTFYDNETQERRAKLSFFKGDARLKATTVHSFKGWEGRAVVVHLSRMDDPQRLAAAYAALTRLKRDDRGSHLTVVSDWEPFSSYGSRWPSYFNLSNSGSTSAVEHPTSRSAPYRDEEPPHEEDFDAQWRPLVRSLKAHDDIRVEPGDDVVENGRVLDLYLAAVSRGRRTLILIDDSGKNAAAIARALNRIGKQSLRVRPDEENLAERILEALE